MASLISIPVDLSNGVDALNEIAHQLSRIGDALDRISPAVSMKEPLGPPAGLSDLRRTDPRTVANIKEELQLFAENHSYVLDSDAFVSSIMEYERQVAQAYGDEAISELPWNKAAGGPIFRQGKVDQGQA